MAEEWLMRRKLRDGLWYGGEIGMYYCSYIPSCVIQAEKEEDERKLDWMLAHMIPQKSVEETEWRVGTWHVCFGKGIRKLVADEALPIEVRPAKCLPGCPKEDCGHKNILEVWTWVASRRIELEALLVKKVIDGSLKIE